MGGSRHSNCSMLEAIRDTEALVGKKLDYKLSPDNRAGDHIWYVSDVRKFQNDYPAWSYKYDHATILKEMVAATRERHEQAA
jgi:CDP-paratose 2-epimerase